MITVSDLGKHLEQFDNMPVPPNLPISQQTVLTNLRMLNNAPDKTKDISKPLSAMLQQHLSSGVWTTLSSFEKLVCLLAEKGNPVQIDDFFNTVTSQKAQSHDVDVQAWLVQVLHEVCSNLGGSSALNGNALTLSGSLPMKYSIFMALMSCKGVAVDSPVTFLDEQHIDGDVSLLLNWTALSEMASRSPKLTYVSHFLQNLGFSVDMGSKTCAQAVSTNPAYLARNNALLQSTWAITLPVADALSMHAGQIVLPLTLKITTHDDALMQQLESYYAHDLVKLVSRDGTPKTFIIETRAPGLLHESVINLNQLDALMDFFERLAFFSSHLCKSPTKLTETEINTATLEIYTRFIRNGRWIGDDALASQFDYWVNRSVFLTLWSRLGNIDAFEAELEKKCKAELIPGPQLFMGDHPFIAALHALQTSTQSSADVWPNFKEEYAPVAGCSTPHSPVPMHYYAQAIARATLSHAKANISSNLVEHNAGVSWLNKTVTRQIYGSAANQHYIDFYTNNNAYYLLDTLVSSLKTCLDSARCTEHHVAQLLELLDVSSDVAQRFRHASAPQQFNRFQIKLFLVPLVLHALIEKKLLLSITASQQARDAWVCDMEPDQPGYVSTPKDWVKTMVGWKNMQINGIFWHRGGPQSTSAAQERRETQTRNTMFGGGAKADMERKTTAEQKSTVSHGSAG